MKSPTGITIWKDAEALAIAAAHFFVTECQRCMAKKENFVVALSGGTTPKRLYQLLASLAFSRNIPWNKVFLFWSDERFVPHTDTDSNYRMVKENLLDHIAIPAENVFAVPVNSTPKKNAKEYEAAIEKKIRNKNIVFDLVILGLGDDGHTASLFPGTSVLKEKKRYIKEVWVEQKQNWRISFTLPLINHAAQILFLVAGKEKATILADILHAKKVRPALPAQLVNPVKGTIYWMLDEEAAAKI
ncbi:MAG: 6-phosphogluconolactonase [Bacteroidota bacterium]|nr:6-phosphogluconolactonase [Bacteroidota bacterium]